MSQPALFAALGDFNFLSATLTASEAQLEHGTGHQLSPDNEAYSPMYTVYTCHVMM